MIYQNLKEKSFYYIYDADFHIEYIVLIVKVVYGVVFWIKYLETFKMASVQIWNNGSEVREVSALFNDKSKILEISEKEKQQLIIKLLFKFNKAYLS